MYEVRIERDSVNPQGDRLTTFVVRFPRVCLAEVVTHRVNSESWGEEAYLCERTVGREVSKNSASSRAIPFKRMVEQVLAEPYVPEWTLQQKGMQGLATTDTDLIQKANDVWLDLLQYAAHAAGRLHDLGVHKQDCNRALEPWAWITQAITSSRWDNFFALRCHSKAFPPFRKLARMMYCLWRKSTPVSLKPGQWHLPFVPLEEQEKFFWLPLVGQMLYGGAAMPDPIKKSAARMAWLSYENHDRDGSDEALFRTYTSLFAEAPVHGCYDAETEVLTGDGWKPWPAVTGEETFATISPDNEIQYHRPSRLVAYQHDGSMYAVKTQHVDLLVTPGHRMLCSPRTNKEFNQWSLRPVDEFTKRTHKIRVGGGEWEGDGELGPGKAELLGFFIGDGSFGREGWGKPTFHLRRQRKIDYLNKHAAAAGFQVFRNGDTYRLDADDMLRFLISLCYDNDREKQIPRAVLSMKKETLLRVLDGLINSDGSVLPTGKTVYMSTSRKLIGQFQELALKCDLYASARLNSPAGEFYWGGPAKAVWQATLFRNKYIEPRIGWTTDARKREVQVVPYSGMAYCVTVPNGTVYVRRNGKAVWCGNSPVEAQATPAHKATMDAYPQLHSNLAGWLQARKLIPHEATKVYAASREEMNAWDDVPAHLHDDVTETAS